MRTKPSLLAGIAVIAIVVLFSYLYASRKPHSVTLSWTPTPAASSYNIYRSTTSGGPYTKMGTSTEAKYVDTPVPGGALLYYVVTSVSGGKESGYSSEIKATVP